MQSIKSTYLLLTTVMVITAFGFHSLHHKKMVATHAPQQLQAAAGQVNLIDQNWSYMPGVSKQTGSLEVHATGFKIVHQDGTGGQDNPAINLYGFRLTAGGDYSVSLQVSNRSRDVSVALYAKPDLVSDEFRYHQAPSLVINENGNTGTVLAYDGSNKADVTIPQATYTQPFSLTSSDTNTITITQQASKLTVSIDGRVVGSTAAVSIRSGEVWFGLSSNDGSFNVTSFFASALAGSSLKIVDSANLNPKSTSAGLQTAAASVRSNFRIGAAVALAPLVSDATYRANVMNNFGSITLENAMKPQFISPKQGVYEFKEADALIDFAKKHDMVVHGHTIAFSEGNPQWMNSLPTASISDRQHTTEVLLDYARTVAGHFKNSIASMDVINEPFDTNGGTDLQRNIWYKAMGAGYLAKVSQVVYAAAPTVQQFINENGAEQSGDRQDALVALAMQVNAQGGHIAGLGLQSHVYSFNTDEITADDLNIMLNKIQAAGLIARISELDVTDDSGPSRQAVQFRTVVSTCLKHPSCVSVTTWGVNDAYDVFQEDDASLGYGHDLMFDNHGKPNGAYRSVLAILHP